MNDTTMNSTEQNEPSPLDGARERLSGIAENPAVMLLGGMALGFLAGLMLPVSRIESERLAPIAEDVKGRVREAGGEVMRRGSEVLKETIDATREAALESIKQQTGEWQSEQSGELSGGTGTGLQQASTNLGPGQ